MSGLMARLLKAGSNAQLDGNLGKGEYATTGDMRYYNVVEDGSRGNGWYQIDGAEDLDADGDTDWYYIDDGEIKYADGGAKDFATYDDDGAVYVQRIKVEGKYFSFNEKVGCRMAYSTARLTADSTTSMTTAIGRLAA